MSTPDVQQTIRLVDIGLNSAALRVEAFGESLVLWIDPGTLSLMAQYEDNDGTVLRTLLVEDARDGR